MSEALIDHVRELQADARWSALLGALGGELEVQLDTPALRLLMARVGARFAARHPLENCATLPELEQGMNRHWQPMAWGLVQLEEGAHHLRISHQFCPLPAVLPGHGAAWSVAFLEGVYQAWFDALGVDPTLRVTQVGEADAVGSVELRLSRQGLSPGPAAPPPPMGIFS